MGKSGVLDMYAKPPGMWHELTSFRFFSIRCTSRSSNRASSQGFQADHVRVQAKIMSSGILTWLLCETYFLCKKQNPCWCLQISFEFFLVCIYVNLSYLHFMLRGRNYYFSLLLFLISLFHQPKISFFLPSCLEVVAKILFYAIYLFILYPNPIFPSSFPIPSSSSPVPPPIYSSVSVQLGPYLPWVSTKHGSIASWSKTKHLPLC